MKTLLKEERGLKMQVIMGGGSREDTPRMRVTILGFYILRYL
jgi:hypothetical protein